MNEGEETEIAQKLADLKAYQEQYDSMSEAERRYEVAFNWLEAYGYIIKWSKVGQAYEAYKDNTS